MRVIIVKRSGKVKKSVVQCAECCFVPFYAVEYGEFALIKSDAARTA